MNMLWTEGEERSLEVRRSGGQVACIAGACRTCAGKRKQ